MFRHLENIFSWFTVGLLMLFSLVPLRVLLLLSRPLAFFVHHVIRYRREVVTRNLKMSFPDMDDAAIAAIRRRFYIHFCDLFFETIRLLSAPKKSVYMRCRMNPEGVALLNGFYKQGLTVITLSGHFGNWEYQVPSGGQNRTFLILPVYRPLRNKAFDWFLARIRKRFSDEIITDKKVARTLVRLTREKTPGVFGLVADQSPGLRHAYWLNFLNQDTAVFYGPEKMARAFKLPVVFLSTQKISRGKYTVNCELIAEHPEEMKEGEVTRIFFNKLESEIRKEPAHYLWTHRRWKHQRNL